MAEGWKRNGPLFLYKNIYAWMWTPTGNFYVFQGFRRLAL